MRPSVERAVQLLIAVAGVASIVATGGGGSGDWGECSFFSSSCNPYGGGGGGGFPPPPVSRYVTLSPSQLTVQVGTPAAFTATAVNLSNPVYTWCRIPKGGSACLALPQATGSTYTIPAADMSDDGARFQVTVNATETSATSDFSDLAVSSLPGVVFEDGEFAASDWTVDSAIAPTPVGPTFTALTQATGGHPGAFRNVEYDFSPSHGLVKVFQQKRSAEYHPTSQGEIYLIEFSEDCWLTHAFSYELNTGLMIEQEGRRFAAGSNRCGQIGWLRVELPGLTRADFILVDGPACPAGQQCPDFSATAAPLRLGLYTRCARVETDPVTRYGQDIDNWKVTIWRR